MKRRRVAGIILVLAATVLYAFTLDNGLQPGELHGGDLITHQYAQVQARPSNAPGYPIYTMGGWLWFHSLRSLVSIVSSAPPNPIPILSSYSTLWALLALWLLYEILCMVTVSTRWPAGNWPVAILVSSFYACTYFFWYYATTTEQYSSAIAQTLAIVLVLLYWLRRRDSRPLLYLLAFLCGLSLAHMLTVAFIVPPVVAAVLWMNPRLLRDWKAVAGSLVAAAVPLLAYAFVYMRGASHPEWWGTGQQYASTWQWFLNFVSTSQGREELMWAFEPGRPFLGNGFPSLIGDELTWLLVIAGLIGIAFLREPLRLVLYATVAIYVLFSWAYRFGNWFQVILPAYALLLIGVGVLADRWQKLAASWTEARGGSHRLVGVIAAGAPLVVLALLTVWRFDASLARADSRNRLGDDALDHAATLLAGPLPRAAAVFASVDDALALQYLTEIWQLRPDVQVVSSDEARDLVATQPLFSTWDAADTLSGEVAAGREDLSWRAISPDWLAMSSGDGGAGTDLSRDGDVHVVNVDVLPGLVLESYAVHPSPTGAPVTEPEGAAYDVTLQWQLAGRNWPQDVAISLRPTLNGAYIRDPASPETVLLVDHTQPAGLEFADQDGSGVQSLSDPYRIQIPALDLDTEARPGFAIVLYRHDSEGFEDILRLDYPLSQ